MPQFFTYGSKRDVAYTQVGVDEIVIQYSMGFKVILNLVLPDFYATGRQPRTALLLGMVFRR